MVVFIILFINCQLLQAKDRNPDHQKIVVRLLQYLHPLIYSALVSYPNEKTLVSLTALLPISKALN